MIRSTVVVGGSLAGLFATAALASRGIEVTVLERDRLPQQPVARKGVPQSAQVHVLLRRALDTIEDLLPGLLDDLVQAGAARFDGGRMPWLSEFGWLDSTLRGFSMTSCTRPFLEHHVQQRVRGLPGVVVREETTATGLSRTAAGWAVDTRSGSVVADVVIDASGRGSRLPSWLSRLGVGVPEPEVVDIHLGYACRLYRERSPLPVHTGVVVGATPASATGGLAMPVENKQWLLMGGGLGDRRPGRDAEGFRTFLAGLRDPALAELADLLQPVSDVAVHRQTQNRRFRYESVRDWPDGLLVVGDAACSFNPIYGQGIAVAARQAQVLAAALATGVEPGRRLQRRLAAEAELPWELATAQDLRQPTVNGHPTPTQGVLNRYTELLAWVAARGGRPTTLAFRAVQNLIAPPGLLLHPLVLADVASALVRRPPRLTRPAVLAELSTLHQITTRVRS